MGRCHAPSGCQRRQVRLDRKRRIHPDKCPVQTCHCDQRVKELGIAVGCRASQGDLLHQLLIGSHLFHGVLHPLRVLFGRQQKGLFSIFIVLQEGLQDALRDPAAGHRKRRRLPHKINPRRFFLFQRQACFLPGHFPDFHKMALVCFHGFQKLQKDRIRIRFLYYDRLYGLKIRLLHGSEGKIEQGSQDQWKDQRPENDIDTFDLHHQIILH